MLAPEYVGISQIAFTVECKSSNKPWILFSSETGPGMNVFWTYCLMNERTRKVLVDSAFNKDFEEQRTSLPIFDRLRWLKKTPDTAYSFRQAFSDNDVAYAALTSAMKAASYCVRAKRMTALPHFRLVFPLIVVDSPLLLCKLSGDNEPEVKEVESGEVLFANPDDNSEITCVRVVSIDALPEFLVTAKKEITSIRKELLPSEKMAWAEEFGTVFPEGLGNFVTWDDVAPDKA